jgi:integrase
MQEQLHGKAADPVRPSGAGDRERILEEIIGQLLARLKDPRDERTIGQVIEIYLEHAKGSLCPEHFEGQRRYLLRFAASEIGGQTAADASMLAMKSWLMSAEAGERVKSDWTRAGIAGAIHRAMNFAVKHRLIRENPFRGVELGLIKNPGRAISSAEFRAILRWAHPPFKRFLITMRLTGARPSELGRLRWHNIDWRRNIAVLAQHKTARYGRPRTIYLPPPVQKLLKIILRDRHGRPSAELRAILERLPGRQARSTDVNREMRARGFTWPQIRSARKGLGVVCRRVGGYGAKGFTVFRLPPDVAQGVIKGDADEFVFVNRYQTRWERHVLCRLFRRLAKKAGLPRDARMYGTRHAYITEAVKRGTPLKAVAALAGHSNTRMVDMVYCHVDGDVAFLAGAAAMALGLEPIVAPPADAQEDQPEPQFVRPEPRRKATGLPANLYRARVRAFQQWQAAKRENPELRTDEAVYLWLRSQRRKVPATLASWRRYLAWARKNPDLVDRV